MVFTGVRLSWVAFRLGAMINYEFSNLLHNEVTPSNPIKENHQDPHFFLVNIYFPGILSLFLSCLQTRHMYFFPLKEKKNPPMVVAFEALLDDGNFLCLKGDTGLAFPRGIQACGWSLLCLPSRHRRPVRWTSFCCIWVAPCWYPRSG